MATTTQLWHRKLIKAELIDHGAGGQGWGINIKNTFIHDSSTGGYDNLGQGLVSGDSFKIEE